MKKIINTVTTYDGTEHRYLAGYAVRIVAVLKDGARLTDDGDIARAGGVAAGDRVEVQPWMEEESRFSFVTSDPRAVDLECFATLARGWAIPCGGGWTMVCAACAAGVVVDESHYDVDGEDVGIHASEIDGARPLAYAPDCEICG